MYIVLTGDLKSSKKMEDRYHCQEKLKNTLNYINDTFIEDIIADFRIIGGDGFQGMISKPEILIDIYFILFEKINYPFYLGIGIADISTSLSDYIEEIDGKAFHFSSESLSMAKKKKRWVILRSNFKNNDLIECILNFIFELMWNWNSRRREVILFYRKNGENSCAVELVSREFKTGIRNVYKTLEVGKYSLLKYGENVLKEEFKKEFKNEM